MLGVGVSYVVVQKILTTARWQLLIIYAHDFL